MAKTSSKHKKQAKPAPMEIDEAETAPSTSGLPPHLELQRTRMVCGPNTNLYTTMSLADTQFKPGMYDKGFSIEEFRRNLDIDITSCDENNMVFHMKGASPALANSLRRIMVEEAPTVAIETVYIVNNTGVIHDEHLAHRLGLIPLKIDPSLFEYRAKDDPASASNTVVLRLKVKCTAAPDGTLVNDKVTAGMLEWLPEGSEMPEETQCYFARSQATLLKEVKPVVDDILITKLALGQEVELEAHCVKGVGQEHAKWSPVATTWYAFMPEVVLLRPVQGEQAKQLAGELPGLITVNSSGQAVVGDPLEHELLLEKVRRLSGEPEWQGVIELRKVKDHNIYSIECTGAWRPNELFAYATRVLASKCDKVLEGLQRFPPTESGREKEAA